MVFTEPRYINPYTDFGFKKLFGSRFCRLLDRPRALQDQVFTRLFEQAEIARFTPEERMDYEESLKVYRDLVNVMDTAERKGLAKGMEEGFAKGLEKGREEGELQALRMIARRMKAQGLSSAEIQGMTGLSAEMIDNLK
ncbi:MAG: hypothetical protein K6A82_06180 [Prevotella sp.]|nr:hypothetical protein [Prevotella sp.]